jgi:drug/metabolite transporter (DMT)-like permease
VKPGVAAPPASTGPSDAPAHRLAPLAAAASGVLVGSGIVATRSVVEQAGPVSLALLRYAIGFACLVVPVALAGWPRFARRDLLPIALLGIGQFGVLIVLLNIALASIPSARAALLFATVPLLTMLLGAALGVERLATARAAGVLLTIVGVGLALGDKALQGGAWTGELAAFASALCGAVCSLLYRPYLRRYPTLGVSALAMLAAVLFLALLATGEGFFAAPPRFTAAGWAAVLFIGANSGVGYYLWLWALGHTTPTKVAVFLSLSPLTAAVLGAALLGETLSAAAALGVACVILGLWLAHRPVG